MSSFLISTKKKIHSKNIFLLFQSLFFLFLPFSIAPKNVFMGLTVIAGIYYLIRNRKNFDRFDAATICLALLFVVQALSSKVAGDSFKDSFSAGRDILKMALVFFVVRHIRLSSREICWFSILPLLISFLIVFVIGFIEFHFLKKTIDGRFRMMGPVNRSAVYILLMFCVSLSVSILPSCNKIIRGVAFISALFASIGILVAASRSAWAALIIIAFLFATFQNRYPKIITLIAMVAIISISLGVAYYIDPNIMKAKLSGHFHIRLGIWQGGLEYYHNHANKLLGIGTGNYRIIGLSAYTNGYMKLSTQGHNMFIHFLVENGILGLFAFIGFFISSYASTLKKRANSNLFFVISLLAIVGMFISCCFHNSLFREFGMLFCIIIAISLSQLNASKAENQ